MIGKKIYITNLEKNYGTSSWKLLCDWLSIPNVLIVHSVNQGEEEQRETTVLRITGSIFFIAIFAKGEWYGLLVAGGATQAIMAAVLSLLNDPVSDLGVARWDFISCPSWESPASRYPALISNSAWLRNFLSRQIFRGGPNGPGVIWGPLSIFGRGMGDGASGSAACQQRRPSLQTLPRWRVGCTWHADQILPVVFVLVRCSCSITRGHLAPTR